MTSRLHRDTADQIAAVPSINDGSERELMANDAGTDGHFQTTLLQVRSAVISSCGLYRYRLERETRGDGATAVIMVNPSTADATQDDATIRKLIGFGHRHHWGTVIVGNLFAYRATDVRELKTAQNPVGPDNDIHLLDILREADRVIVAWGPVTKQPKHLRDRYRRIPGMAHLVSRKLLCIGEPAKCGHPKHPLMLPYDSPILPWSAPA